MSGMLGNIHSIETFGTVDGPGVRFVVFMQGCPMRCAYCHNPDTWKPGEGRETSVSQIVDEFERNRAFYRNGGITVTGGEPLLQPQFVGELFAAMHEAPGGRVHTCLDTSGFGWLSGKPERFEKLLGECDLVLLDVKHAHADAHKRLTGCDLAPVLAFGDELARRNIPAVIRHVAVPGITDSEEECEALGRLIAPWRNVVGLEVLPYHTMGVGKYAELGIEYPLAETPAMNKARIPALRQSILRGMKAGRAQLGR